MSGGGGNGGDLLGAGLAIAAMVATDGAAAAFLPEAMGMSAGLGASALGGAALGATSGALGNALMGGDVGGGALKGGILGGIGGGASNLMSGTGGATSALSGANATPTLTAPQIAQDTAFSSGIGELAGAPSANSAFSPYAKDLLLNSQTTAANAGNYFDAIGQAGNAPIVSSAANQALAAGPSQLTAAQVAANPSLLTGTSGKVLAGGLGLAALMQNDKQKYGIGNTDPYNGGDLSMFRYNPSVYRTASPVSTPVYVPRYASGGIADAMPPGGPVEQMSRDNSFGQNQMFPQSQIQTPAFASPTNTPFATNLIAPSSDTNVDPYTGAERFAAGGSTGHLGGYAAGGNPRLLKGPGDGMSDNIPATIAGKQPARLADGEFVIPADVVSHIGNGSTDAGAKQLHSMMDRVRKARTGVKRQGKQIKPGKYLPA